MPKISAASVELHIQKQTALLLDTASSLFQEKGYLGTDMGDIAKAMGLARNSLYRYYPNKDHILLASFQRSLEPRIAREQELLANTPDALERLDKLIDSQIDFATGPDHPTIGLIYEIRNTSPELGEDIKELHVASHEALATTVQEILAKTDRNPRRVTSMMMGIIHSSSTYILEHPEERQITIDELKAAIHALIHV